MSTHLPDKEGIFLISPYVSKFKSKGELIRIFNQFMKREEFPLVEETISNSQLTRSINLYREEFIEFLHMYMFDDPGLTLLEYSQPIKITKNYNHD